jgi:hypothetical protein
MDINVEVSAGGQIFYNAPQQNWREFGTSKSAIFAGQIMTLDVPETGGEGFELIYLGFKSNVFLTELEAKFAAPRFATLVLEKMLGLIH